MVHLPYWRTSRFGLHFVIGIETAAGLFHGLDQGFTGHADGVAHHELRTGTAGRAAHGGLGGVVHDKADLVGGGNIQGTQGLVGRAERAGVGALTVISPAHADGDRAVFIVLRPAFRRMQTEQCQSAADTISRYQTVHPTDDRP